jgi:ATP-dependent RNA helicase SUPV3L1/SUV3
VLHPSREVAALPGPARARLLATLQAWLAAKLVPLEPLERLYLAAKDPEAGSQARALLLNLIGGHGYTSREHAGIEHLPKEMRPFLRRIGVTFGALDIFAPALLKPAPRQLLHVLGIDRRPLQEAMLPVIAGERKLPSGYRPAGEQAIRIDLAEKILRAAHEARARAQAKDRRRMFVFDLALPVSIGLDADSAIRLLGSAGFRVHRARPLAEDTFGPPRPDLWEWRPSRRKQERAAPAQPREGSAFAALADLIR